MATTYRLKTTDSPDGLRKCFLWSIINTEVNMPEAKQLHKRAHNMVGKKTVDAPSIKIPVTEAVVVKVLPTEKHESFEDFYPLHVTKVDSVKENTGMGPLIIGIVLIIVVGVAAFWYVKQQEFADTGAPFHMPIISPTAVATLLE